jgi:AcrR family transcriptional regulator
MMPVKKIRNRENPVVRRAQIVDEAIRIIGERGYNGFTVQALAERCGLSNAGLLYYFESKDALLLSLLDEMERREMDVMSDMLEPAFAKLGRGDAPGPIIFGLLRKIILQIVEKPELNRFLTVLLAESLYPEHPAHRWFKSMEEETSELFTRLSVYLVDDAKMRARELVAMMHGLQEQWFRSDCEFDLVEAWEVAICRILPVGDVEQLRSLARAVETGSGLV